LTPPNHGWRFNYGSRHAHFDSNDTIWYYSFIELLMLIRPRGQKENTTMTNEITTYRRTEIKLFRDADGFWGWTIGRETMLAMFSSRSSAFGSAKRHIDDAKRA
jgi:hypothetical protein